MNLEFYKKLFDKDVLAEYEILRNIDNGKREKLAVLESLYKADDLFILCLKDFKLFKSDVNYNFMMYCVYALFKKIERVNEFEDISKKIVEENKTDVLFYDYFDRLFRDTTDNFDRYFGTSRIYNLYISSFTLCALQNKLNSFYYDKVYEQFGDKSLSFAIDYNSQAPYIIPLTDLSVEECLDGKKKLREFVYEI